MALPSVQPLWRPRQISPSGSGTYSLAARWRYRAEIPASCLRRIDRLGRCRHSGHDGV